MALVELVLSVEEELFDVVVLDDVVDVLEELMVLLMLELLVVVLLDVLLEVIEVDACGGVRKSERSRATSHRQLHHVKATHGKTPAVLVMVLLTLVVEVDDA